MTRMAVPTSKETSTQRRHETHLNSSGRGRPPQEGSVRAGYAHARARARRLGQPSREGRMGKEVEEYLVSPAVGRRRKRKGAEAAKGGTQGRRGKGGGVAGQHHGPRQPSNDACRAITRAKIFVKTVTAHFFCCDHITGCVIKNI